jgi:aminoglycoside phosphotransferase (APT) family kinase protein
VDEASDIRAPLEDWLGQRLPAARELRISGLRKPGAGESSETQLFELDYEEDGAAKHIDAVLRCAPRAGGPFPEYDLGMQFHVMRVLGEQKSVPVPEVLWLEDDPGVLGVPFLLMRSVEGNAPLDFPSYQGQGVYHDDSAEQRAHMWNSTIEALACLHEADWKRPLAGIVAGNREGEDPARQCLHYWRHYLDHFLKDDPGERVPVFDDAMEWLEHEFVEPERLSLCWGDAKLGNVLYAPVTRDVAAVIDWEMATIGDPEYDLASLHLSDLRAQDGAEGVALPGTPSAEELIALYERHSGRRVRNFHYAMVFATFWRGSVQIAVMRHMRARGVDIDDALFVDNFPTRTLQGLLRQK